MRLTSNSRVGHLPYPADQIVDTGNVNCESELENSTERFTFLVRVQASSQQVQFVIGLFT